MRRQAVVAGALIALSGPSASAFQIESIVTTRCHERITADAVGTSGWPDGLEPPALTRDDEVLIADVPFSVPDHVRDRWGVSLLIGVRHPDIGDNDPTDLAALTSLHNNPALQPEHCLRLADHDDSDGDVLALETCRAHILNEIGQALDDAIDVDQIIEVPTYLKFRGEYDIEVNRFAFHMGRALHALQDSYTHTFRNPASLDVRSVHNWVEGNLGASYDESRDGHRHESVLDDCGLSGDGPSRREDSARQASAELLVAVFDPEGGRDGRMARAEAVLDEHLALEDGCTTGNDYCGAPELGEIGGCSSAGAGVAGLSPLVLVLVLVLLLTWRRDGKTVSRIAAGLALLAATGATASAQSSAEPPADDDEAETAELERQDKVIQKLGDPTKNAWGAAISGGGALDRGAAALSAGVRFNPSDWIGIGLDLEVNPWFSFNELDVAAGVINLYAPVSIRLKSFGSWELKTTVALGISRLNVELVGAERGSIGPYVGWNPLGVSIPMGADFKLVVKPGDIAVPIPQVSGIPFYYHQYRSTVSLEWYPD